MSNSVGRRKKKPMQHYQVETKSECGSGSSISTVAVSQIVEWLRVEHNRDSTRKNYLTIWHIFSRFFLNLDVRPWEWEDRIILLARYLINQGKKATTVKSNISAIKSVLWEDKIRVSADRFLLNSLVKACQYWNDRVLLKFPIYKELLNRILKQLDKIYLKCMQPQPYLAKLYKAVFSSAYYGLLRVSEVAKGKHPVLAFDVHIGINKNKILFLLRTSRMHWKYSRPQSVKIMSN